MKKTLVTIIGEHQSEAIKNITLLYSLSTICVTTDESYKLNKNLSGISLDTRIQVILRLYEKDKLVQR